MNNDNLTTLITKENITLALSILGSAGTILGTVLSVFKNRKNLKLKLPYFGHDKERKLSLAYVQFENKSHSSILITDINLVLNGKFYPCVKLPSVSQSTVRKIGGELFVHDIYNLSFPIFLAGVGGTSGYLLFDIPQYREEDFQYPIHLQVSTNRGHARIYKLSPAQECL